MASPEELARLLRDALVNYYDPVRLQSHALNQMLNVQRGPGETVAEALRRCLREGIDRLRPPSATPQEGAEWLGHRVLLLHYVRSLSPAEVCHELNISEATFYRRQREALQALASLLWNAHCAPVEEPQEETPDAAHQMRDRAIALASRLPSEPVQLSELIRGIHQTITPLAARQGVGLRVIIPRPLPSTCGDPSILRQAVLALLTGCVAGAREGSVELRVWADDGTILGRIAVIGVEPGALGTPSETQGFQLGAELLQIYGGAVWSEPAEDSASSICFSLKALEPVSILIIDDDRATAELYTRYLSGNQYVVTHAHTAEEAEAAVAHSLPDLILLDVLLPRRDGWLILEMFKSSAATHGIPVIVCSVIEERDLALALGAAQVLTKPITREQLLQSVQTQLALANSREIGHRAGPADA